jgi:XTP/dITP diphosphohydrolase
MKQLIIATNNEGKIREIKPLLENIELLSLKDINYTNEIPEPYLTFEENALAKATAIYEFTGKNVFADDSGLGVNALRGAPGVISAHYSDTRDDEKNLQKVLSELKDVKNRRAYYKAILCLIWEGETHFFEGICLGNIALEKRGTQGFGYDPIFIPDGYDQTFGELPLDIKNSISHRGKAVRKLVNFLKEKTEH